VTEYDPAGRGDIVFPVRKGGDGEPERAGPTLDPFTRLDDAPVEGRQLGDDVD